jgi:hypothetical protein
VSEKKPELKTAKVESKPTLQTAKTGNQKTLQTASAGKDKTLQAASVVKDKMLQTASIEKNKKLQTASVVADKKTENVSTESAKLKTSTEGTKHSFESAKNLGNLGKEVKTILKKADKDGTATAALTSAGVAAVIFKSADKAERIILKRFKTASPRYVKRKFKERIYKIKRTVRTVKSKVSSVKKVLTTPITKQTTKLAAKTAAKETGKLFKTSAKIGAHGMLKTAKIGAAGYGIAGSVLSKSNNESAAAVGNAINFSRVGAKAVSTSYKTTTGTAKAGAKTIKTAARTVKSIKTLGIKKSAANFAKSAASRIGAQAAKFASGVIQFTAKKALIPIILIVAVTAGAIQILLVPIQAVGAFIDRTVGWLFNDNNSSLLGGIIDFDEAQILNALFAGVDNILADTSFQNTHINNLRRILPDLPIAEEGMTVPTTWTNFTSSEAVSRANQQIRSAERGAREWGRELAREEGVTYGGLSYEASIDFSVMRRNDFRIQNHIEFFCMAFFMKFPFNLSDEEEDALDDLNLSFSDDELRLFLLNSNIFTPVANGFPILKNRLDIEVRILQDWETISEEPLRERVSMIVSVRFVPRLVEVSVNPRDFFPDTEENQELFESFDFAVEFINEIINDV